MAGSNSNLCFSLIVEHDFLTLFSDLDPNTFEPILDVTTTSHVQSGLSLRAGAIYITRIKARNQAKLIASHETSGIRVDPTPPVVGAYCYHQTAI